MKWGYINLFSKSVLADPSYVWIYTCTFILRKHAICICFLILIQSHAVYASHLKMVNTCLYICNISLPIYIYIWILSSIEQYIIDCCLKHIQRQIATEKNMFSVHSYFININTCVLCANIALWCLNVSNWFMVLYMKMFREINFKVEALISLHPRLPCFRFPIC